MLLELEGKWILVTGGSRGLGYAVAAEAARQGAHLILASRSEAELKQAAHAIQTDYGRRCVWVVCDVSEPNSVEALFDAVDRETSQIFGLVCAAALLGPVVPLDIYSIKEWTQVIQTNLVGSAHCAALATKRMKSHGQGGRILFFAGAGEGPQPCLTAYAASKGAIWRLTESLAAELKDHKIWVNAIAPGPVQTRMLQELIDAGQTELKILAERNSAQNSANLARFLLSDHSSGLYGKVLSALWDDYLSWPDLPNLSTTTQYTMKRVTPS